jgi:Tol biopolymer transport system component
LVDESDKNAYDWSVDGKYVIYWSVSSGGTPDLWIYSTEDGQAEPLIEGEPNYVDARFSPDATYVTYTSDESGRPEVFAQTRVGGARWQVSTNGGALPHWRHDGNEIVYIDADRTVMVVSVETGSDGLALGTPRELFALNGIVGVADATGDHERFLIATLADIGSEPLHVILDWPAGL